MASQTSADFEKTDLLRPRTRPKAAGIERNPAPAGIELNCRVFLLRDLAIVGIPFINSQNVRHSGMFLAGIQRPFTGYQLQSCWYDGKDKRYFYNF